MKKLLIVYLIVILAGCSQSTIETKKIEDQNTGLRNQPDKTDQKLKVSQLTGTWLSVEDNYEIEVSETQEANVYKLEFKNNDADGDDDLASLTTDDAVLAVENEKFSFTSESHKVAYSFIVDSSNRVTFFFSTLVEKETGVSRPTKMEKIN